MSYIVLDIETIPSAVPTDDDLRACSRKKTPETIEKDLEENRESLIQAALKKKGTSYYDSKIVCMGFTFNDEEPQSATGDERYLLEVFENAVLRHHEETGTGSPEGNVLIGFNSLDFDFPILFLKACYYNLKVLKSMLYYCHKEDVMKLGTFNRYGKFVSMDALCKFFNIEGKGDIDGSMVYPMYKEGKIEEIVEYCRQDVLKTRKLYKILKI